MSSLAPNSNVSSVPAVAASPNLINFPLTSKLPPNCRVVSVTTSVDTFTTAAPDPAPSASTQAASPFNTVALAPEP